MNSDNFTWDTTSLKKSYGRLEKLAGRAGAGSSGRRARGSASPAASQMMNEAFLLLAFVCRFRKPAESVAESHNSVCHSNKWIFLLLLCYKRTPRAPSWNALSDLSDSCRRFEIPRVHQKFRAARIIRTTRIMSAVQSCWNGLGSASPGSILFRQANPEKIFNRIILRSIVHTLTTLRDIFASSLTGLCDAIRMRVGMFPAGIMASVHSFSCWLLRSLLCSCLKNRSMRI